MSNIQKNSGFSLFMLWFGAAVSLSEIMTGSLIAPLGFEKGILVIIAGHIIGTAILAMVGLIGFNEKKPGIMASRYSLGRYGSYIVSIFNVIQLIGWTAIMMIQCTRSLGTVTSKMMGFNNFIVLVIITGILVAIWALNNDNGISFINNAAVILLLILCIVVMIVLLSKGTAKTVTGSISLGAALELAIVMPLSWVPLISDYTMLGKSKAGSFWGSFAGYFLGSIFMYIIGLASAIFTGASDPIAMLNKLNMGYAALIIVILSTVTTTFLDVYSAVMSTLNIFPKLSKKALIIIFSIAGTILAMLFPMEQYENFLYLIGSFFAPVFTVILLDYFIYKKDKTEKKVNVEGIICAAVGIGAYYLFIKFDLIIGSTLPAMAVTAFIYCSINYLLRTKLYKKGSEEDYLKI